MLAYSYLRFSSAEQRKGDSIRRQIAKRAAYLTTKGLTLDDSLVFADKGMSSFRGKNAIDGELRFFLDCVKAGRIRKGSYLIVENLDRLSRDKLTNALPLFLEILKAGVIFVTLFPEQEFSKDNLDFTRLILGLAELCRGHSESVAKSERSRENWSKRRANLGEDILTSRRPSWLNVIGGKFVVNNEKIAVVKRIFILAAQEMGSAGIARLFNKEKVKPISKADKRHESHIWKILTNRAFIGEFQPRI